LSGPPAVISPITLSGFKLSTMVVGIKIVAPRSFLNVKPLRWTAHGGNARRSAEGLHGVIC
jgi:hypothetical protein